MKNIYFDTEFSDFNKPALISIGLVGGGREFYAELNDTYDEVMCSGFVRSDVLPLLDGKSAEMGIYDLRSKLKDWIESFSLPQAGLATGRESGGSVQLFCDAPTYDWQFIQLLFDFGVHGWPDNLVRKCENTQVFENDSERFRYNNAYKDYWRSVKDAKQHHALWDARCIAHAHRYALRKRES